MQKNIPFAHHLLKEKLMPGDIAIDATCGNGNDTVMLAKQCGNTGHIYAFDIQDEAITATKKKLEGQALTNVTYIQDSHALVDQYLPENCMGSVAGAIFNLGFLPKSDKSIITTPDSTMTALTKLLPYIRVGGRIVLVVYHGHTGGIAEKDAVLSFVQTLDQTFYEVIQYGFINQKNNPPFVIGIEKIKEERL